MNYISHFLSSNHNVYNSLEIKNLTLEILLFCFSKGF
jgi:hypothetical protein